MGKPKLDIYKVKEIKDLRQGGMKLKHIAAQFDVSMATVSNIARGYVWNKKRRELSVMPAS